MRSRIKGLDEYFERRWAIVSRWERLLERRIAFRILIILEILYLIKDSQEMTREFFDSGGIMVMGRS